ncbi:MAG TPA: CoA transferase [Acidimicrobiales bacterium]|nr:CoA transferase [Acidimicrobiales bacterium]
MAVPACDGLRVLELGQGMAGAMPGMILADNGADVVKIEPPWGDPGRRFDGARMWDRGKRSIALDLRRPAERERALALAERADVLVEALRPGVADALGMGWEVLRARNDALVYCSISAFGPASRYAAFPGYEGVVAAVTGHMMGLDVLNGALPGQDRAGPIYTAVPVASFAAAQLAVHGVLAALHARDVTGRGDRVSTSLVQGLAAVLMRQEMPRGEAHGAPRATPEMNAGVELCFMTAQCADGRYLQMCARQDHHFRAWLEVVGLAHRLDEPRYARAPMGIATLDDIAALDAEIRERMRARTSSEWMEAFIANDIGADPFLTPDEFLAHPQMTGNGRVVAVSDAHGTTTQVGTLASFATTPGTIGRGAPGVGEHGAVRFPDRPAREARAAPEHPLSGVTVVEMAYFIAGPLAGALLAEMGARVIKIEPPGGDPFRRLGLQFAKTVHGKESIVLDLKAPGAGEVVGELAARADVFVHTFRPGVAERLGIDAATLLARNPRLVYVHGTSYGSKGPWAGRPAFHSTPSALAGSGILQAGEGNPPVDDSYPDPCSALGVATAVLLGLQARARNGTGDVVETTMLTTTAYAMSPFLVRYPGAPPWRLPDRGQHGTSARHRLYRCQQGWAFVGCVTDDDWDAVASTLELPPDARTGDDSAVASAVGEVLRTAPAAVWQRRALAAGAPVVAVSDVPKEAWMEDEKLLIEASHPAFGDYWRPPVRVGFERLRPRLGPAAAPGEHTRAILAELGRSPSEIDALLASGAAIEWAQTSKGAPQ